MLAHRCALGVYAVLSKKKNAGAISPGRKGGKATAKKLTAKQRKESAKRAALERWHPTKEAVVKGMEKLLKRTKKLQAKAESEGVTTGFFAPVEAKKKK